MAVRTPVILHGERINSPFPFCGKSWPSANSVPLAAWWEENVTRQHCLQWNDSWLLNHIRTGRTRVPSRNHVFGLSWVWRSCSLACPWGLWMLCVCGVITWSTGPYQAWSFMSGQLPHCQLWIFFLNTWAVPKGKVAPGCMDGCKDSHGRRALWQAVVPVSSPWPAPSVTLSLSAW